MLSDQEIRKFWKAAGGSFHGPNVETATIPEQKLFWFVRDLIKATAITASTSDTSAEPK